MFVGFILLWILATRESFLAEFVRWGYCASIHPYVVRISSGSIGQISFKILPVNSSGHYTRVCFSFAFLFFAYLFFLNR